MRTSVRVWHHGWVACVLLLVACGGGSDATKIADALTERLDIEGGTVVDEPPPPEHPGDSSYPQVTALEAPQVIKPGESFQITLGSDFSTPADVMGAVVYVENATKHIGVAASLDSEAKTMTLTGVFTAAEDVPGDQYQIKIAMRNASGIGNYQTWSVLTPRTISDCRSACNRLKNLGCWSDEYYTLDQCAADCAEEAPSLECFMCIDLDTCEEIFDCADTACYDADY